MPKFEKGQSGNPAGRKRGTGHAAKLRNAIEADLPDIIGALVDAAKSGDTSASKLLLDRVMPSLKPVLQIASESSLRGGTLAAQGKSVITELSKGEISPDQAQAMLSSLANLAKIIETDDLEKRIASLEKQQDVA